MFGRAKCAKVHGYVVSTPLRSVLNKRHWCLAPLAVFGAVYEKFSHRVYSFYMVYAFIFPLAGRTFPFLLIALSNEKNYPGVFAGNFYHSGIATLTAGCVVHDILDIYGITNYLLNLYRITGAALPASHSKSR